MPYYYAKVEKSFKNISDNTLGTFAIDNLSTYMFLKETLCVAEWFQSIQNSMENANKIIQIILLQPSTKNDISNSDASFIIHLLPDKAVKSWLKSIKKEKNWENLYNDWLERFEDEEDDEESDDDEEDDEESDDDEDEQEYSDESSSDDSSDDEVNNENGELDIMPELHYERGGYNWFTPAITV